jgi:hypothetical protein
VAIRQKPVRAGMPRRVEDFRIIGRWLADHQVMTGPSSRACQAITTHTMRIPIGSDTAMPARVC